MRPEAAAQSQGVMKAFGASVRACGRLFQHAFAMLLQLGRQIQERERLQDLHVEAPVSSLSPKQQAPSVELKDGVVASDERQNSCVLTLHMVLVRQKMLCKHAAHAGVSGRGPRPASQPEWCLSQRHAHAP